MTAMFQSRAMKKWGSGAAKLQNRPAPGWVACVAAPSAIFLSLTIGTGSTNRTAAGPELVYSHPYLQPAAREEDMRPAAQRILREIRQSSALTWEHLAKILGVTRRSLHNWANGHNVESENQRKLAELKERIDRLGSLPPYKIRASILAENGIVATASKVQRHSEPVLEANQAPLASPPKSRIVDRSLFRKG